MLTSNVYRASARLRASMLALCLAPSFVLAVPAPLYELTFDTPNVFENTGSVPKASGSGSAGISFEMQVGSGSQIPSSTLARDLHTSDAGGVSGKSYDRAFDNSGCTAMGAASGPAGKIVQTANNSAVENLRSFTLSGWFSADTAPQAGAILLSRIRGSTTNGGFELLADASTPGALTLRLGNGSTIQSASSGAHYAPPSPGAWVFFAVSYDADASSGQVKFYRAYRTGTVDLVTTVTLPAGPLAASSKSLTIGNAPDQGWADAFDGKLDNIRIHGSTTNASVLALSASDLLAIRNADVSPVRGRDFYVSTTAPNASNNNPGTAAAPWRTLYFATTDPANPVKLQAGDRLLLSGTFTENLRLVSGDSTKGHITYEAAPGATAVLDGVNAGAKTGADGWNAKSWVRLRNLTIRRFQNGGAQFNGSTHVLIENCVLENNGFPPNAVAGNHGVRFRDSEWVKISDTVLRNNGKCGLMAELCANVRVERVDSYENRFTSTGYFDDADGLAFNNCENVRVSECAVWSNGEDGLDAGAYEGYDYNATSHDFTHSRRIHFSDCVAFGHPGKGITISGSNNTAFGIETVYWIRCEAFRNDPTNSLTKESLAFSAYEQAKDLRMAHCTAVNSFRTFRVIQSVNGLKARNNIFSHRTSTNHALFITDSPATPTGLDFNYNLWSGPRHATLGHGVNDVLATPLYVNAAGDDYRPASGSPAINAGTALATATAAGANLRTVPVSDASFFCDGWKVNPGDLVRVGAQTARVVQVNTTSLELDRTISWNLNDPISFPYSGTKPDIGAHEF